MRLCAQHSNHDDEDSDEDPVEEGKRLAAHAVVDENVRDDMVVGVGSGPNVAYAVERLAVKVWTGMEGIVCVPTSFQSRQLILGYSLMLSDLEQHPQIDVAIDGADEIDAHLDLIKGSNGCLTQEKIVASCADKFYVVADSSKESSKLGKNWKMGVPIEVVPMAWEPVKIKIESSALFGGSASLRMAKNKAGPLVTENGNFILDWRFDDAQARSSKNWDEVNRELHFIPGVVETGLFCDMTTKVYFALEDGTVKIRDSKVTCKGECRCLNCER